MAKVSWIYLLSKPQLMTEARKWQLSEEGSVEILRERLVRYVREHPEEFEDMPDDG